MERCHKGNAHVWQSVTIRPNLFALVQENLAKLLGYILPVKKHVVVLVLAVTQEPMNQRSLQLCYGEAKELTALKTEMVVTETECARACVREATCVAAKVKKMVFAVTAQVHKNIPSGDMMKSEDPFWFRQATNANNGPCFEARNLCEISFGWFTANLNQKWLLQVVKELGPLGVTCLMFQEPVTGSGEPEVGLIFRKIPVPNF